MGEKLSLLLSDRINRYAFFSSIGVIVVGLTFFLINVWTLPPLVPIFYNRPWGLPQLGSPIHLLLLIFASIAVFVLNITIALAFQRNVILLSRILLWIAVLVSLLSTTAVFRVILLVT